MAIAAGVVGVACKIAAVAFFDVATEGCRAADLNGAHDAQLMQRRDVSFAGKRRHVVEKCRPLREQAVASGIISGLPLWLDGSGFSPARRADWGCLRSRGSILRIARRCVDAAVAEQHLNDARIGAAFE